MDYYFLLLLQIHSEDRTQAHTVIQIGSDDGNSSEHIQPKISKRTTPHKVANASEISLPSSSVHHETRRSIRKSKRKTYNYDDSDSSVSQLSNASQDPSNMSRNFTMSHNHSGIQCIPNYCPQFMPQYNSGIDKNLAYTPPVHLANNYLGKSFLNPPFMPTPLFNTSAYQLNQSMVNPYPTIATQLPYVPPSLLNQSMVNLPPPVTSPSPNVAPVHLNHSCATAIPPRRSTRTPSRKSFKKRGVKRFQ